MATTTDFEKITVADTAIGFTASKIKGTGTAWTPTRGCQEAFVTVEIASGNLRFRMDGTDPTTTVGHLLKSGDSLLLSNPHDIKNFRAIRTTATSGYLHVSYRF